MSMRGIAGHLARPNPVLPLTSPQLANSFLADSRSFAPSLARIRKAIANSCPIVNITYSAMRRLNGTTHWQNTITLVSVACAPIAAVLEATAMPSPTIIW
jgi:hypothetical protein